MQCRCLLGNGGGIGETDDFGVVGITDATVFALRFAIHLRIERVGNVGDFKRLILGQLVGPCEAVDVVGRRSVLLQSTTGAASGAAAGCSGSIATVGKLQHVLHAQHVVSLGCLKAFLQIHLANMQLGSFQRVRLGDGLQHRIFGRGGNLLAYFLQIALTFHRGSGIQLAGAQEGFDVLLLGRLADRLLDYGLLLGGQRLVFNAGLLGGCCVRFGFLRDVLISILADGLVLVGDPDDVGFQRLSIGAVLLLVLEFDGLLFGDPVQAVVVLLLQLVIPVGLLLLLVACR